MGSGLVHYRLYMRLIMTHTTLKEQILAEFDEKFGKAIMPPEIKSFLSQALDKASRAAIEACEIGVKEIGTPIANRDPESHGWNAARNEMKSLADKYLNS